MFARYQPRPLAFHGVELVAGYRLKVYSICYGGRPFDPTRFQAGWDLAATVLPQPVTTADRPGIGFAVLHQGKTGDYLILSWWDRENELPTRVFFGESAVWRPAAGGESFCVWDLRVMWWEREAYVGSVLAGRDNGIEAYLAAGIEGDA